MNAVLNAFDLDLLDVTAGIGDAAVAFRDFLFSNDLVNKGFEALGSGVKMAVEAFTDLVDAIENIPQVQEFIENFKNIDWSEIGSNVVEGLKNGLEAGISSVPDILIEIGQSMLSAIKGVLGIHSPSTEISEEYDLYGIPNVVEVVYSKNNSNFYVRVINDDPNSPTSTVSRGREIIYRDSNPEFSGEPTNYQIKEYANKLLQKLSTVEYKITFSHGYYPIRLGDCVLLNYKAAGINNVKAKVIKQSITCETGCKVTETAVYTSKLWG